MSTDIIIKKGLDIKLKGVAKPIKSSIKRSKTFAINPLNFHGVQPKMIVKVGDKVDVGDTIFYSKDEEKIKFTSPVSGKIKEIVRGSKRKILSVQISPNDSDTFKDFGAKTPKNLAAPEIKETLLESGCWSFIKQRPYDKIANPDDSPKSIFISAFATAPLAASHEFVLEGREKEFQAGIDVLTKLTEGEVHLSINKKKHIFFKRGEGR